MPLVVQIEVFGRWVKDIPVRELCGFLCLVIQGFVPQHEWGTFRPCRSPPPCCVAQGVAFRPLPVLQRGEKRSACAEDQGVVHARKRGSWDTAIAKAQS